MGARRPPDILRKSHAHTEGKVRARDKRALRDELTASLGDSPAFRALLIDLDGVVYRGDELIPGAAEAIRWLRGEQIPHLFVTNTTSRPREALVAKLGDLGIEVTAEEILAPPDAAAGWLAGRGVKRLLLAVPEATAAAFSEFETLSLDQASEEPESVDALVIGDIGAEWNFARLNSAFRCLMRDPPPLLVALGMTRYWHAPDGLRLDTAPFVVALAHASGIDPVVLGKPAAEFFEQALERLGVNAADAWMIGDDIKTDVGGAQAAGLKGILVRTGKYRPEDLNQGIAPDLILDSLASLAEVRA